MLNTLTVHNFFKDQSCIHFTPTAELYASPMESFGNPKLGTLQGSQHFSLVPGQSQTFAGTQIPGWFTFLSRWPIAYQLTELVAGPSLELSSCLKKNLKRKKAFSASSFMTLH